MRLLSFGHGYSARALSKNLVSLGWKIRGTTRSSDNLENLDVEVRVWPNISLSEDLEWATHLLISIPPNEFGDCVLRDYKKNIIKNSRNIRWVGYLSTTGVYGNHNGAWVNEETKLRPTSARALHRLEAENEWLNLYEKHKLPVHIFRLAGIYGPGRGPFSKVKLGKAKQIIKRNQLFSRIHVEDIATTLEASILKPKPGSIYNVCDDFPAPPEEVILYAARLLGLPDPPKVNFEDAKMSAMARSFYSDSKRVRNNKIKSELNIKLKYPNYKSGLKALIKDEI